jgi:hypothetical protein
MSFCKVKEAMLRVEAATPQSPVVVRRVKPDLAAAYPWCVEVFFYNTVLGKQLVNEHDRLLIGVFHNAMSRTTVFEKIQNAIYSGLQVSSH